jgi:hypothetical protein
LAHEAVGGKAGLVLSSSFGFETFFNLSVVFLVVFDLEAFMGATLGEVVTIFDFSFAGLYSCIGLGFSAGTSSITTGEIGTTLGIGAHVRGVVVGGLISAPGVLEASDILEASCFAAVAGLLFGYTEVELGVTCLLLKNI